MNNLSSFMALWALLLPLVVGAQPAFQLESFASGFTQPVDIAHAGDERLFVVEKRGRIRIINGGGEVLTQPFLDIDARVRSTESERGLLGLTFHPGYAVNGYFYVNYTGNDGHTRISRFSVSPDNPNVADPESEQVLLTVNQPFDNHNAGDLSFGPDGYLYIGLGDGGAGGDPFNNSQDRLTLLGKMLRIDVNNGDPYAIPEDNPFAFDDFTLDEIWALGLRNPWRFSFDRETGDLWIADVGQDDWEEIDLQLAGSPGGENYGWRCYEGNAPFNTSGCEGASFYTAPVHVYPSNFTAGCSVTGGFVYRGSQYDNLYGAYIYADFCTGRFWTLVPDGAGGWTNTEVLNSTNNEFATFGEDQEGELYVAGLTTGQIYRIVGQTSSARTLAGLKHLRIQPNPAADWLRVELETVDPMALTLQLRDLHGQVVFSAVKPATFRWTRDIDLEALPPGLYLLSLEGVYGRITRKVVRQ